jgi:hypothetical protein
MGRKYPAHFFFILFQLLFGFSVAISAVNRLVAAGLKRYFGLFAALRASRREHLPRASVAKTAAGITALGSSGGTASGATLGLIGIALGSEELLLFGRKREGFSAIGTLKGFLCESH